MARTSPLGRMIIGGFLIAAGSVLGWAGCAQSGVPVTSAGAPIVDFQPRERVEQCTGTGSARSCRFVWTGDVIIAHQVAARGLIYRGDDIEGTDGTVRVAWVPATLTVARVGDERRGQWWFVAAAVLIVAGGVLEEGGRRRLRSARTPP